MTARAAPAAAARSVASDVVILVVVLASLGWLVVHGAQSMHYQWQWYRIPALFWRVVDEEGFPGPLLRGLVVTLQIASLSAVITLAVGLGTALLLMSPSWAAKGLATVYLEVVRNTPILVQIYVFYFVLAPLLGIGRFTVGVLSLSFFEATLAAEVMRGSIQAVPRGQWEAGRAMGLRPAAVLRGIVLPQALPLMIPPMTGVLINLVKHSAIVSVIAIADLATEARNLISDTLMSFEIWLTVAGVYLVFTLGLSVLAQLLERRLDRPSRYRLQPLRESQS